MMHFNKDELKLILRALEIEQKASSAIATDAVIKGDYIGADAAIKYQADRERLIRKIEQYLKR